MTPTRKLRIVVLGLTITSTWGNGHATTYRALVKALARRGHDVLFLERDVPWYAEHRDLASPPFGRTALYRDLDELAARFTAEVEAADLAIVGSFVPDGVAVCRWVLGTARGVRAFYDIDTPVTLERLAAGDTEYLDRALVPRFDLYLSFTGGPVLERLEREFGAARARPLYCSVDVELYRPARLLERWDLGYLGTYAADRQPALERLMLEPARRWFGGRFVVGGPLYPGAILWPRNVDRQEHVPAGRHPAFYGSQRWTLNLTRAAMVEAGHSPSVRLFEAAACGVPVISDSWPGLETFFTPGREILVASNPDRVLAILTDLSEEQRVRLARAARERVLREHTSERRAIELETWTAECAGTPALAPVNGGTIESALESGASA